MGQNQLAYILAALFSFSLFTGTSPAPEQEQKKVQDLKIMFYNVENLFDTLDAPDKDDAEFLPDAKKQWNSQRYQAKLDSLARVIGAALANNAGIVGLAEIENRLVLDDLVAHPLLAKRKFKIQHQESPDERGIDVALLVPEHIVCDSTFFIPIHFAADSTEKTRDILMARVKLNKKELWLAVAHFPSRSGGEEVSRPKRMFVASELKSKMEQLKKNSTQSSFLIMGDFNDEPADSSMYYVLGADSLGGKSDLVNLMWPLKNQGKGTYKYRDSWNMLDQFIVSRNLMENSPIKVLEPGAIIYSESYLMEQEGKFKGNPWRTFAGNNYLGGYSDHFPILITLRY